MAWDVLITNIKGLVQVRASTPSPIAGADMAQLPTLENAYLAIAGDKIASFGTMDELTSDQAAQIIDATGRFVFPSYVDSHTHLVFAASREEEFEMKIRGATYAEIAASGGGILNSAKKLRAMSEDELYTETLKRAWEIIRLGTGAVEIKSGYGLTVEDEMKMLRVARRIGRDTPLVVKTTLLGAHAVPSGVTKSDYVNLVIDEMIPAAAAEKLADYVDVFCEQGFFDQEETERIGEAGRKYGMKARLHANQLSRSGGVQAGIRINAISVDHLENIGDEEIELLKSGTTLPTALPAAAFFLNLPYPPARKLMEAGLSLAIASDYNPGSAPTGDMSMVVALACIKMRMTPAEAINAATINTAAALELLPSCGSITTGKQANVFITAPMSSIAYLPYKFGSRLVDQVILKGNLIG